MVIRNAANGKILSESAVKAITYSQKTFGLIFSKNPCTMIFQTRFGIHTFFMKYPIDVLVLDQQNTVVAIKKSLKPNRIFVWNPKYEIIIELPTGSIEKTSTKVGSRIILSK
jgi:uncharacterized membrane protein (UPF0127 family)